ncbi:MAG: hypothetical protein Q9187_004319 [Circinaria calcarea]
MDRLVPETIESTASLVGKTAAISLEKQLNGESIIRYDQEAEKSESEYHIVWNNIMAEGKYLSSSSYTDVAVLLISWEKDHDDLDVKEEVNQLEGLFINTFNYQCSKVFLTVDKGKSAQVQINYEVARFALEHDSPNALLIFYYAGHGLRGNTRGDLQFHGKHTPSEEDCKRQNQVIWNLTEAQLYGVDADILLIFDCKFEYLAATSRETTKRPGKDSFTSALIWALKELVEVENRQRFTVSGLVNKIKHNAPHFPSTQSPVLTERGLSARERIVLAPLPKKDLLLAHGIEAETAGNNECRNTATQVHLILKFILEKHPTIKGVEQLGRELNKTMIELNSVMPENYAKICRIDWGGLRSPVRRVADRWWLLTQQRDRDPCLNLTPSSATLSSDQSSIFDRPTAPTTPILDESNCITLSKVLVPESPEDRIAHHIRMIWKEVRILTNVSAAASWGILLDCRYLLALVLALASLGVSLYSLLKIE